MYGDLTIAELGLNLKNTPLIVEVSRSLSLDVEGTNPLIPWNTNSLRVVFDPSKHIVDSSLLRVVMVEIAISVSVLVEPPMLLPAIPAVRMSTNVSIAATTVGHLGSAVSAVIVLS